MPAILGRDMQTGQSVSIGDIERRSGLYVLGKPGFGKSTLLVSMMLSDIHNGYGVFFIDPHGDAIHDLIQRTSKKIIILDPENERESFGINLLACSDTTSLKQRTDTYTRAYNIFHKLWEDQWGPWLQLIIQNTLYVFIENQEYTLAEVPLFFINPEFRNHLVSNVKFNQDVADFWKQTFGRKREYDQQMQVEAALTRVSILLGHPYIKHIIGQQKTTVNLDGVMQKSKVLLIKLSANLAPDIKKFIGTILIRNYCMLFVVGRRIIASSFVFLLMNFSTLQQTILQRLLQKDGSLGLPQRLLTRSAMGNLETIKKSSAQLQQQQTRCFFN